MLYMPAFLLQKELTLQALSPSCALAKKNNRIRVFPGGQLHTQGCCPNLGLVYPFSVVLLEGNWPPGEGLWHLSHWSILVWSFSKSPEEKDNFLIVQVLKVFQKWDLLFSVLKRNFHLSPEACCVCVLTALSRNNWYTINSTYLKCTIWSVSTYMCTCEIGMFRNNEHIHYPPKLPCAHYNPSFMLFPIPREPLIHKN